MLLVKTYAGPSNIQGLGLFAGESIKKGRAIWKWIDEWDKMITIEEVNKMPELQKNFWLLYGFVQSQGCVVMCGDNGRFINHSNNPNLNALDDITIAARDIKEGEELTEDYRKFDHRELLFTKES